MRIDYGEPFVGKAGKLMNMAFQTLGIKREEVYIADEAFFTGTAAEITPIRDVDARVIGCGSRGPVTEKIQSAYFDVVAGKNEKYIKYLTYVN